MRGEPSCARARLVIMWVLWAGLVVYTICMLVQLWHLWFG